MGPVRINVYDWKCRLCQQDNYYSGRYDGIFPYRRTAAYSTDYMYCLVDLVCRLSISQRVAYESLNVVSKLTIKLLQLEFTEGSTGAEIHQLRDILKRRRVTEALGLFFQTVNYGETSTMKVLYHCDKCETCLTDADKRILGIPAGEGQGLKRYKGIVIDGTSCGILAEITDYERDGVCLTAPSSTGRKFLVTAREEKRILKAFFTVADKDLKLMMRNSNTEKHFFLQQN